MENSQLMKYYQRVRRMTEEICRPLEIEDYVIQPIEDVSPAKWHLAHTTWFFEKLLLEKFVPGYQSYHPLYNYLFNSYYHTLGERWERPHRGDLSRPTVREVYEYRAAINDRMLEVMETLPQNRWAEFQNLAVLGLNHEQQHQELLITDLKYSLAVNPLHPVYRSAKEQQAEVSGSATKAGWVEFGGGIHQIGHQGSGFCYDNEQPAHKVYLQDFRLQNRLVTNREYLEFIEAGGYCDFRFWLSDGWETVQQRNWRAPLHWIEIEGEWHEFTLSGVRKLHPESPVTHVSFYEAEAFASWAEKRLPTEAEWEVAAQTANIQPGDGNFLENGKFHPQPASVPGGNNKAALVQMLGDAWEWTGSAYLPYPGYKPAEGALGEYNAKFMIDQMVLRGGSCATPRDHIRRSYRNFFQPDKRWQFSGIRLAENI